MPKGKGYAGSNKPKAKPRYSITSDSVVRKPVKRRNPSRSGGTGPRGR